MVSVSAPQSGTDESDTGMDGGRDKHDREMFTPGFRVCFCPRSVPVVRNGLERSSLSYRWAVLFRKLFFRDLIILKSPIHGTPYSVGLTDALRR